MNLFPTIDPGEVLYHLPILYTPNGYVKAIQEVGGLPVILPISEAREAEAYISQIDKLVLAGGQNVSPKFYGQNLMTLSDESFLARDEFELALIDAALKQNKPIFAVCRGMQLLNVALGGSLQQDIRSISDIEHMQTPIPKEIPTHSVYTKEKSMLETIYGKETLVNSFHQQAVDCLAGNFTKTAWSADRSSTESLSKTLKFFYNTINLHLLQRVSVLEDDSLFALIPITTSKESV